MQLNRFYEDGDVKDYEVLIHAIKSNAGAVGAKELQGLALRLEKAASKGRMDLILADHEVFMNLYRDTVNLIKAEIG